MDTTNPLLEALAAIGGLASAPGGLFRGLLAGRPGEQVSGSELIGAGDDPLLQALGFGIDLVADPLNLAIGPALKLLGKAAGVGARAAGSSGEVIAHAAGGANRGRAGFFDYDELLKILGQKKIDKIIAPFDPLDEFAQTRAAPLLYKTIGEAANPLTPLEAEAAKVWVGQHHGRITRALLRQQYDPEDMLRTFGETAKIYAPSLPNATVQDVVQLLDDVTAKGTLQGVTGSGRSPKGIMVYRGASGVGNIKPNDLQVGQVIQAPEFMATSIIPNRSGYYGGTNREIDIIVPGKAKFGHMDNSEAGGEILLPRNKNYRVLGLKSGGQGLFIRNRRRLPTDIHEILLEMLLE